MPEEKKRRLLRRIVERIVITGQLRLETPAHFGNGETDSFTDMPLLMDELDNPDGLHQPRRPLLPGTSIAGALRNHLRERELGDCVPLPRPKKDNSEKEEKRYKAEIAAESGRHAGLLFGGARGDDDGNQSPLIVHDALGTATAYELRDGVRIEPETRTAEDKKKYDITLLAAGATFDLRFDLLIWLPEENSGETLEARRARLLEALVTALDGLARGEITLGARKRRGFGRCRVDGWCVRRYDLRTRDGLLAWLAEDRDGWLAPTEPAEPKPISEALGEAIAPFTDARKRLTLNATFSIDGSLMVRSGAADRGPDLAHLRSPRSVGDGGTALRPIVAGTSWAGVLRSRATQIAYTLAPQQKTKGEENAVTRLIDRVFGPAEIKSFVARGNSDNGGERAKVERRQETRASRIEFTESVILEKNIDEHDGKEKEVVKRLEQTRIKIDRFTGGAFESALFSEEPLFGNKDSRLKLELSLRLPDELSPDEEQAEIGLLLLLLKDLWTGDLPLGGEVGIGRGRLKGLKAEIRYGLQEWQLAQADNGSVAVVNGDRAALQSFVAALREELRYARTTEIE
jgi:CRISPR/Cas system CSM-associated protein Csm3 (group 7 of RAMP superfamily)